MKSIVLRDQRIVAVFSHGHVIALFLHALEENVGREEAELLTNPDVLKVDWEDGAFSWDRKFRLPDLTGITTTHSESPKRVEPNKPLETTPDGASQF